MLHVLEVFLKSTPNVTNSFRPTSRLTGSDRSPLVSTNAPSPSG